MHRGFYSVESENEHLLDDDHFGGQCSRRYRNKANPAACDRDERDSASLNDLAWLYSQILAAIPMINSRMIRLMLYLNELDVRLLVASSAGTLGELKEPIIRRI